MSQKENLQGTINSHKQEIVLSGIASFVMSVGGESVYVRRTDCISGCCDFHEHNLQLNELFMRLQEFCFCCRKCNRDRR